MVGEDPVGSHGGDGMAATGASRLEDPIGLSPSDPGERLAMLVRARWAFAIGVFVFALVVVFGLNEGPAPAVLPTPVFLLALPLVVVAQNAFVGATAHLPRWHRWAILASVGGDLATVTAGLHGTGGVASWLWALYPLVTLEAAFLTRDTRATAAAALAGIIAFALVQVLEAAAWLPPVKTLYTAQEQSQPLSYMLAKTGWVALVNAATAVASIWALAALDRARLALEAAYERLAMQYNELRELDRLKGNFLSVVAHELRTPLTIAGGYAELAEDDPGLTEEGRAHLAATTGAIASLAANVDLMIAYVEVADQGRPIRREPVRASEVLEQVFESQEAACREAGLVLMHDEAADELRLEGDGSRLASALGELVENARRATPPGGTIGLGVRMADGLVTFEVWDTGPGIPAPIRARLGEAFLQPDAALTEHTPGLGLGLAYACLVAGRHGGSLTIADRAGGGAAVLLSVPASATPEPIPSPGAGSGADGRVVARPG